MLAKGPAADGSTMLSQKRCICLGVHGCVAHAPRSLCGVQRALQTCTARAGGTAQARRTRGLRLLQLPEAAHADCGMYGTETTETAVLCTEAVCIFAYTEAKHTSCAHP